MSSPQERAEQDEVRFRPGLNRRFRRRWGLTTLLVLLLGAAVIRGYATRDSGRTPVRATAPTQPYPVVEQPHCYGTDGLPANGTNTANQVWVDANPISAVVLWLPGQDFTPCRSVLTQLDATQARALATAVRISTPFPAGQGCPADNGSSVTVFFRYANQPTAEVVNQRLSGCQWVTAPGHDHRVLPQAGLAVLRPYPAQWSVTG
ncbi:MAG: hypothetical protein J0H43_15715 [Actinobacteria bacterium]|nr:hypothetical protein [Actinomycetota bacterium]